MADQVKDVCRSFRNTKLCRYGDNCKFVHSEGEPIPQPLRKIGECYGFRDTQNCERGDKCRFVHGAADPRVDPSTGALQRFIGDEICRNFLRNLCRFGDQCRRKHEGTPQPADAQPTTDKPKRRRARRSRNRTKPVAVDDGSGAAAAAPKQPSAPRAPRATNAPRAPAASGDVAASAPRGRGPRRSRGPRGPSEANAGANAGADGGANAGVASARNGSRRRRYRRGPRIPTDQIVDEQGREVCRTFYHLHNCRFADQCRFIHVAGPNPIQFTERPPQFCRTFALGGSCTYGDLCRYKHGEADARDMAAVAAKKREAAVAARLAQGQQS